MPLSCQGSIFVWRCKGSGVGSDAPQATWGCAQVRQQQDRSSRFESSQNPLSEWRQSGHPNTILAVSTDRKQEMVFLLDTRSRVTYHKQVMSFGSVPRPSRFDHPGERRPSELRPRDGCGQNLMTHIEMRQDLLSDEPPT